MDETSEIINNFQSILQKQKYKKPPALYSGCCRQNLHDIPSKTLFNPSDIVSNISKQIKAIHSADCVRVDRRVAKNINKYQKSAFVSVNMLSIDEEVPQQKVNTNKLDTQCVSDSQLLNIIQDAEAQTDANRGMTQEFETSFLHTNHNYNESRNMDSEYDFNLNEHIAIVDISLKEPDPFKSRIDSSKQNTTAEKYFAEYDISVDTEIKSDIINKCIEVENDVKQRNIDIEISPSPVFSIKPTAKKSNTPSPLMFDLKSFENFEKIAVPYVEEGADFETAKHLINSQFMGHELFIHTDTKPIFTEVEQISPVLKVEGVKVKKVDVLNKQYEETCPAKKQPNNSTQSTDKYVLKDEILFSSDEDDEYIHKDVQELPFTCALETSFYEQSGILDKTMYVGFQTASNKSIQVATDSFTKAKNIFDDVEKGLTTNEPSLTELVEICDNTNTKTDHRHDNSANDFKTISFIETKLNQSNLVLEAKEIDSFEEVNKNVDFIGYRTASGKSIEISEEAIIKSKVLFQYDSDPSTSNESTNDSLLKSMFVKKIPNFEGFKTASNKIISLSKKALLRSKKVFRDLDFNETSGQDNLYLKTNFANQAFKDMESELPKSDYEFVNDKSLNKIAERNAKLLTETCKQSNIDDDVILQEFENIEMEQIEFTNNINDINKEISGFVRFKTASDKAIKISDNALARTKNIFQDIQFTQEIDEGMFIIKQTDILQNQTKKAINNESLQFNLDLKTASNKKILMLEQAVARKESFFYDNFSTERENLTKNIGKASDIIMENSEYEKKHLVSESTFLDEDFDLPTVSTAQLIEFKTANIKPIIISEDALDIEDFINKKESPEISNVASAKSKMILQNKNINEDSSNDAFGDSDFDEPAFYGFESVGKKHELEDIFIKTKKIIEGIDDENIVVTNSNLEKTEKFTPFCSFQTACIEPVEISAEAIANSMKKLQDIDADVEKSGSKAFINVQINDVPKSQGFQTVSNKTVKVAENALTQSKMAFLGMHEDIYTEDKIENEISTSKFQGFKTASNKNVKISEEALAKSKQVFQEINNFNANINETPKVSISFKGFQTASSKPVKISEEALAKSKKVFQEIDNFNTNTNEFPKVSTSYKGFQTISNKPVKISEEAIAKSKKVFQEIDNLNTNIIEVPKVSTSFKGFQTASNKPVNISEEAIAKSKKVFQEIDNLNTNIIEVPKVSTSFKGFQTASNKPVKISEEAIAKSKKVFQEIDNLNTNIIEVPKVSTSFKGFQTASNKPVNISEEAIAKSKKVFQEIDNLNIIEVPKVSTSFKGFQTASNKPVKISEEALAKSKKVFQDIDDFNGSINKVPKVSTCFKSFQTASNKEVQMSQQVLAKSRQLFQNIDESYKIPDFEKISNDDLPKTKNGNVNTELNKTGRDFGFKTVNNNNIKISEEALKLSRKLFAEIDKDGAKKLSEDSSNEIKLKLEVNAKAKDLVDVKNIIDTQVLNNFDETLNTEDFCKETPSKSKRSGSPILSCPKAKRRKKFETPYSQQVIEKEIVIKNKLEDSIPKPKSDLVFNSSYKKNKKYILKDLPKLEMDVDMTELDVDPYILNFNFNNLLEFKFFGQRNDIKEVEWTMDNLIKCFLDSVNSKFIPEGWINNHLKLILWKLISYEIKFPKTMKNVCSAKNVINQLNYRYDKELYNAERPALRKILEKDDTSTRTLVLCVAACFVDGASVSSVTNTSNIELLVTDGWYCVKACLDKMLSKLVCEGKIVVGSKIVTHGAELLNCDQGVAPWEDTSAIRLKLSGNSTRRARWDARLGYHGNGAILSRLSAVSADGGKVARLRAFVTRVYPTLYVEKFLDGSTVTRSERLEHLYQMKYENERQALMEKLYEEVEKELSDEDSQDSDCVEAGSKRKCLDSGSQIAKVMKRSKDPVEFRSHLTESQMQSLNEHTTKQREKLLQDIQARIQEKVEKSGLNGTRNVVPLLKIRVAGVEERAGVKVTRAMLSIWKPNDELLETITEGAWIDVMNVVPTAVRYSEIQISAGRQSVFRKCKCKESEKLNTHLETLKRTCYTIKDLTKNPNMTTDYNEIDTVGLIVLIEPSSQSFDSNRTQFQNLYLADADKNIICVNFWGGMKKFGFENVLDTGQIVACTNLQKRAGNTRQNIPQYRVTEFSYFTKTPKNDNSRKLIGELTKNFSGVDKIKFYEDCVNLKNNCAVKLQMNAENISPYRFRNIDINLSNNRIFIDSPLCIKTNKIDENLNLTGLDFESTFKQVDTQEFSPKTLLRKRQIKEKMAKLKMYGEPPPLSPIQILNHSKNAGNAFKSPLVSRVDVCVSNVASERENLPIENTLVEKYNNIQCSPVLMNRTFVKRNNVNPVKLDFTSSVAMEGNDSSTLVDQFDDDFDGSPPLSLD